MIYIYKITNLVNSKLYFGQTAILKARWKDHRYFGSHPNKYKNKTHPLYHSMNKYGLTNFSFEIVDTCGTQQEADELETKLISEFKTQDRLFGYNIEPGGCCPILTQETKKKISEKLKRKFSPEDTSSIVRCYLEEQMYLKDIANIFTSSPKVIRRVLLSQNISIRNDRFAGRKHSAKSKKQISNTEMATRKKVIDH